jgi:DNA-binding CsgD family transcriptional regulator
VHVLNGGIVGRQTDLMRVLEAIEEARTARLGLLIGGEPGIGKSTLIAAARERAAERGFLVLATRAVEVEHAVPYAALADLLSRIPEQAVAGLPPALREAVSSVLFLSDTGGEVDQRAVSTGVLRVIQAAARIQPVLLAVDDLLWADPASAHVIAYAARRLDEQDRVAIVATVRDLGVIEEFGAYEDPRLRRMVVGPMTPRQLRLVVRSKVPSAPLGGELNRLCEMAAGNPLRAIALASEAWTSMPRFDADDVDADTARRITTAPRAVRDVLELVAVTTGAGIDLVDAVAGPDGVDATWQAIDTGLLRLGPDGLRFTHSLLNTAVQQRMSPSRRRDLHRACAAAITDEVESASHLARATTEADATVADLVEAAADLAVERLAWESAADLFERAAQLTPEADDDTAWRRFVRAGLAAVDVGDTTHARSLFDRAAASVSDRDGEAVLLWTQSTAARHESLDESYDLLTRALDIVDAQDHELRAAILRDLAHTQVLRSEAEEAHAHAVAASDAAAQSDSAAVRAECCGALALTTFAVGLRLDIDLVDQALAADTGAPSRYPPAGWQLAPTLAGVLLQSDHLDRAEQLLNEHWIRVREQGRESDQPAVLWLLAFTELRRGNWATAQRLSDHGCALSTALGLEVGYLMNLYPRGLVHALRGDADVAARDANEGLSLADKTGNNRARPLHLHVLGLAEHSRGNLTAARDAFSRGVDALSATPSYIRASLLTDLVEVLIELGELDEAERRFQHLEDTVARSGRPGLAAVSRAAGYLRAAGGDLDGAIPAMEAVVAETASRDEPFEAARAALGLGVVERRARRRRAARTTLVGALADFERLGAAAWAARTRAEIARIGGRAAAAPAETGLTPVEQSIVDLVVQGRTNAEIAAASHLAVRTVESHLTQVYRKLGVRSRAGLVYALRSRPGTAER